MHRMTRTRPGRALLALAASVTLAALTSPLPADAAGMNVGAGAFTGTVEFDGAGIPPVGAPCQATSFTLDGLAEGVVFNTTILGYAGDVELDGFGSTSCENATASGGSLTIDAHGVGPTESTLDCLGLTGHFVRKLNYVEVVLTGDCTINGINTSGILFVAEAEFHPTAGDGITSNVTEGAFEGAFVVSPS